MSENYIVTHPKSGFQYILEIIRITLEYPVSSYFEDMAIIHFVH